MRAVGRLLARGRRRRGGHPTLTRAMHARVTVPDLLPTADVVLLSPTHRWEGRLKSGPLGKAE